jgi:hypothetical protein
MPVYECDVSEVCLPDPDIDCDFLWDESDDETRYSQLTRDLIQLFDPENAQSLVHAIRRFRARLRMFLGRMPDQEELSDEEFQYYEPRR